MVALRRWSRECVGRENRVGFGADKRCLRTTSEGRESRTRLQKKGRSKWRLNSRERKKAREVRRCGRQGRGCVRMQRGCGPVGFWKAPPAHSPLSATHSRPLLGAPPARCGPVGTGRLQGARAGIGRWCSTAFAQYLRRYGAQGRLYLAHVAQCWGLLAG